MSNQNADLALDAILESDKTIGEINIHPITIGRYALLELVKSPFITPNSTFTTYNVIPSIYILSKDIKDLSIYDSTNIEQLKKDAFVWIEQYDDLDVLSRAIQWCVSMVSKLFKISPDSNSEGEEKKI